MKYIMTIFFCPISNEEVKKGTSVGRTYAYANKSKWVQAPAETGIYLTAGYVKGVDHVVIDGKAYMLMKTYIDISENSIVILCTESVLGCDI